MNNQDDDFIFEGFDVPGTTPVPDIVFDKLLSRLTGNELKVLLYIIRRTYGFGKNADAISLSQFREGIKTRDENGEEKVLDEGCGIGHNRTILVALASLEKKGCVTSKKRNTNAGDSDTTIYKLRFKTNKEASKAKSDKGVVTSGNHVVTPGNEGSYSTSPRSLPEVTTVVTSGNTQETVLQYTDSQETVLQGDTNSRSSIDNAILTQLQEKNRSLEEKLAETQTLLEEVRAMLPAKGHASPTTNGLFYVHRDHSFITLDDEYHPTVMIVTLTPAFPHPYFSEMEDKRRERIAAWEILPMYKKQGLEVQVHWRHEQERETVVDSSTVVVGGNHHTLESSVECEKQGVVETQPPTTLPTHTQGIVASTGRQETASVKEDIHEDRAHSMDSRDGDLDNLSRHPDTHSATDLRQDASSSVVGNNHLNGTAGNTRSGVATSVAQQANGECPIAPTTTQNASTPPATETPAKPARNRSGRGTGNTEKPKKVKPVVPEEELTLRKEVHLWVNQRRGYSLQNRATTKQIIDENTACITLGHMLYIAQYEQNIEEGCVWDDLSFVWDYSVKNDKYWSQPNNKSRFGAHALLQMFAQTIVKRKPNNVTLMRPANNPPTQQEPTPEKAASIAAAEAVMARLKQRQAI